MVLGSSVIYSSLYLRFITGCVRVLDEGRRFILVVVFIVRKFYSRMGLGVLRGERLRERVVFL